MSVPTYDIGCTNCDYHQMYSAPKICRYEVEEDVYVSVGRARGWCYHCEKVVSVERLPLDSNEEIRRIRQALTEIIEISERIRHVEEKEDVPSLSKRKRFLSDVSALTFNIYSFKMFHLETIRQMEALAGRVSPPRCLECGNNSFGVITFSPAKEDKSRHMSDFQHPGCGGYLFEEETGMRVMWAFDRLPIHIYDTEGNLKRVEERK